MNLRRVGRTNRLFYGRGYQDGHEHVSGFGRCYSARISITGLECARLPQTSELMCHSKSRAAVLGLGHRADPVEHFFRW